MKRDRYMQLHILQFHGPSNLCRDGDGNPKTAIIGNVPRLRISSQAWKRAMRTSDEFKEGLEGMLGTRTQRLGEVVEKHLIAKGVSGGTARTVAQGMRGATGTANKDKESHPTWSKELVFLTPRELENAMVYAEEATATIERGEKWNPPTSEDFMIGALGCADLALFGRMLAKSPALSHRGAANIAHAYTTHRAEVEPDYLVAMDDLSKPEIEGHRSAYVGAQSFGSGTYYIYANINLERLNEALGGDEALVTATVMAFVRAAWTITPSGKQASFASPGGSIYALAELGNEGPRNLGAAFLQPVRGESVGRESINVLEAWCALDTRVVKRCDRKYRIDTGIEGGEPEGTLEEMMKFCTS